MATRRTPGRLQPSGVPFTNFGPSRPAPDCAAESWGPYFDTLFPVRVTSSFLRWKIASSGTNIARRLWEQREALRAAYEAEHGTDPDQWPWRHPGVVLDEVKYIANAACLGCHWIEKRGQSTEDARAVRRAHRIARRHQVQQN